jgi:hypothetical protein
MTRDSGSRPTGRDVQQARGEAWQSGRETASPEHRRSIAGPPPIDHRRFDCMAEYAGTCVCGRKK